MDLDAEFAKRSKMRIYTHFSLPDGVRGYSDAVESKSLVGLTTPMQGNPKKTSVSDV